MKDRGIVRDIALRSAAFTLVGSLVAGAVCGALLTVVPLVAYSAGAPWLLRTLYGSGLPSAINTFHPTSINELGLAGYALVACINGLSVGIISSAIGGISGSVAGLATGVLTTRAFSPVTYSNRRQFRRTTAVAGVVIAAAVAYLVGPMMYTFFGSRAPLGPPWFGDSPGTWMIHAHFPILVIGMGASWASHRVADWYEDAYIEAPVEAIEQVAGAAEQAQPHVYNAGSLTSPVTSISTPSSYDTISTVVGWPPAASRAPVGSIRR
jgi:hypothetical protein